MGGGDFFLTSLSPSNEGTSITSVVAEDADIGGNALLTYSLVGPEGTKYFRMDTDRETNTGILRIFKVGQLVLFLSNVVLLMSPASVLHWSNSLTGFPFPPTAS